MTARQMTAGVRLRVRKLKGVIFLLLCLLAVGVALAALLTLLVDVARDGVPRLSWDFINSYPSRFPERAGIKAALYGSAWMIAITIMVALPLGIGAAVYLEEYAGKNWFTAILEVNIATSRACRRSSMACWACSYSCGRWTWGGACWRAG